MKILLLLGCISMVSCGVNHKASGTVKTEAEVRGTVAVTFPQCDRPTEPLTLVIECIKAATQFTVKVEGDPKVVDLLKDLNTLNEQQDKDESI